MVTLSEYDVIWKPDWEGEGGCRLLEVKMAATEPPAGHSILSIVLLSVWVSVLALHAQGLRSWEGLKPH